MSPISEPHKTRVIVIGAGAAGLACAAKLSRANLAVTLLEASDRVGGRAFTSSWDEGDDSVLEMGATWLHGTQGHPLYGLAHAHGLLGAPSGGAASPVADGEASLVAGGCMLPGGERADDGAMRGARRELEELMEETLGFTEKADADAESVGGWVRQRFLSVGGGGRSALERAALAWRLRMEASISGGPASDLSLRWFGEYQELEGGNRRVGAMQRVLEAAAATLPKGALRLSARVTAIEWAPAPPMAGGSAGDGVAGECVRVRLQGGEELEAEAVVLTCSLGVLRHHVLPPQKPLHGGAAEHTGAHDGAGAAGSARGDGDGDGDGDGSDGSDGSDGGDGGDGSGCGDGGGFFSPPLPEAKADAISRLKMGTVNKVFVQWPRRWWRRRASFTLLWPEGEESDTEGGGGGGAARALLRRHGLPEWALGFYQIGPDRAAGDTTLVAWVVGEGAAAIEALPEGELERVVLGVLGLFLGSPPPCPTRLRTSSWASDPLHYGAYSYVPCGGSGADYDALAAPLCDGGGAPRLLFAGEACHRTFYSTLHGAWLSGEQAALLLEAQAGAPHAPHATHAAQ